MSEHRMLNEMIRKLCASQNFAVLATQDDMQPYCNFIAFSVSEDLTQILFVTPKHTRKYSNLKKNKKVSILLNNRSNTVLDFKDTVVATAMGCAMEVIDAQEAACREHHIENTRQLRLLFDLRTARCSGLMCRSTLL